MTHYKDSFAICAIHGKPTKREFCRACNAAYMRVYKRRVRRQAPDLAILERAKDRAQRLGIKFALTRSHIRVPIACPVLGIPLVIGKPRSRNSPSLDRIDPLKGYVAGNVRVISDHANRIKSNLTFPELQDRAAFGSKSFRSDYAMVAEYVDREALLAEVRAKAEVGGRAGQEWLKVAMFLENAFQSGPPAWGKEGVEDDS